MSGVVTATLWAPLPVPRKRDEEALQHAVMQFLDLALPACAVAHHSPNEGKRTPRAAGTLKRSGTRRGWPDVEILWRGMPTTFIELKTKRGSLDADQRAMHKRLTYCGAVVLVCRSVECVETSLLELGMPLRATLGSTAPMRVSGGVA